MKAIKCLVKSMYMELDAAHEYYLKMTEFKDSDPTVAAAYQEVALQELSHCDKFHQAAVSLINKAKSEGKEVPEAMQAIWDYEHSRIVEEYDELKYKLTRS